MILINYSDCFSQKCIFILKKQKTKKQQNSLLLLISEQNIWEPSCSLLPENPTPHGSSAQSEAPAVLLNALRTGIMKSYFHFTAN